MQLHQLIETAFRQHNLIVDRIVYDAADEVWTVYTLADSFTFAVGSDDDVMIFHSVKSGTTVTVQFGD